MKKKQEIGEDYVEVLGGDLYSKRGHNRKFKYILLIAAVAIIAAVIVLMATHKPEPEINYEELLEVAPADAEYEVIDTLEEETQGKLVAIASYVDSINDVAFTVYPVGNLKCKVSMEYPSDNDSTVMLVTPAADYRADTGGIVGEFIYDKEQMSEGVRKPGYCYVSPAGTITLGAGDGAEAKARAKAEGGCFFRQYALVMDGEICPNILKGKAKRRALGFLNGAPAIVVTANRESIYDFSQALADYGFGHAIYLPGGEGRWRCVTTSGLENQNKNYPVPGTPSYLTFVR